MHPSISTPLELHPRRPRNTHTYAGGAVYKDVNSNIMKTSNWWQVKCPSAKTGHIICGMIDLVGFRQLSGQPQLHALPPVALAGLNMAAPSKTPEDHQPGASTTNNHLSRKRHSLF